MTPVISEMTPVISEITSVIPEMTPVIPEVTPKPFRPDARVVPRSTAVVSREIRRISGLKIFGSHARLTVEIVKKMT